MVNLRLPAYTMPKFDIWQLEPCFTGRSLSYSEFLLLLTFIHPQPWVRFWFVNLWSTMYNDVDKHLQYSSWHWAFKLVIRYLSLIDCETKTSTRSFRLEAAVWFAGPFFLNLNMRPDDLNLESLVEVDFFHWLCFWIFHAAASSRFLLYVYNHDTIFRNTQMVVWCT